MHINHARFVLSAFVSAQGTSFVDSVGLATRDAHISDTYTNPTGSETGATANRASKLYVYEGTIASLGSLSLDFSSGGLTDPFGSSVSFSTMKAIWVYVSGASISLVSTLGMIGSRTFNDGEAVAASSPATGHSVTDGVSDSLVFTNNSETGATVKIVVIGS